jgi:hypothetical protein
MLVEMIVGIKSQNLYGHIGLGELVKEMIMSSNDYTQILVAHQVFADGPHQRQSLFHSGIDPKLIKEHKSCLIVLKRECLCNQREVLELLQEA